MKVAILATSRSGHNWIGEMIKSWGPYDEVMPLTNVEPHLLYQHDITGVRKVIVIRDFKNFLASSLKALNFYGETWKVNIARKIKAYRTIVEEIKMPKYYRPHTVIYYDIFIRERDYRKKICQELGGEYTEDKLGFVPNEGNGSSFDGFEYQGIGQRMKNRQRHEQILETEWVDVYNELLKENEDVI